MEKVIVLDFGYPAVPDLTVQSSIRDLAEYVLRHYRQRDDVVILAQTCTHLCLRQISTPDDLPHLEQIQVCQSNTAGLEDGGSYHVLKEAYSMLGDSHRRRSQTSIPATLVAHSAHAPRAVRQGALLHLDLTPGANLPDKFYRIASQWWCRNKWAWIAREVAGYLPLKLTHQL